MVDDQCGELARSRLQFDARMLDSAVVWGADDDAAIMQLRDIRVG